MTVNSEFLLQLMSVCKERLATLNAIGLAQCLEADQTIVLQVQSRIRARPWLV